MAQELKDKIERSREDLLEELKEFLRIPSVSAQGGARFRECAEWVARKLREAGAEARLMETAGHPVVYAEIGQGERTLLSYGHYDVQPPEPLELWESDPFEPEVRDSKLFARGVADDKGDVLARIQALRLYREVFGEPPFRLKFLIEGEEEVGSPSLGKFVRENADLLRADACLWEGSMQDESGRPLIFCGTKGMLYVELRAKGASHDLHSMYGGIAPNPAWRLVQALRTIKDETGEITLDGLHELADPPTELDLRAIEEIPFDEEALRASWNVEAFDRGLTGDALLRELLLRPTANIAGMHSGYTGPGSKTIVPSEAFVKMDFRLVSGQSPRRVMQLLREHLDRRGFEDVEIVDLGGLEPAKTPVDSPVVRLAVESWREIGRDDAVVYPTVGGSGPTSFIATDLGIPTVMTGSVAWAGSRIHSPNESTRLEDYFETVEYFATLFRKFGER
ncbi:M20/M25/M40 family metallo-hydrolase [Rubrobacter taiwanensis]|jgi:acetylornithine deacetylase/succinyl-diaminopimelate desuccinylase-like protein|uniref:M20/M25/M40 family metallo-hydrolase n=1 Tax=Rubrobacter taiwanensis TaxID=185139 RepID=A0A4R1BRD4_9ACTN|nr:M20/M25/M40 family metallo-hydrolase [Rubrobacter taiwanensis]TCJ20304.1 M20/M25/M40 family metallo-hydrolase [Rubrobacter taiwanensis]